MRCIEAAAAWASSSDVDCWMMRVCAGSSTDSMTSIQSCASFTCLFFFVGVLMMSELLSLVTSCCSLGLEDARGWRMSACACMNLPSLSRLTVFADTNS